MLFKIFKKEEQPDSEIFIDEDDWFSKASWFNSYFWDKLKDMLLNIIYSLYTSIEDKLLRKYFLEITFYSTASQYLDAFNKKNKTNHKGDFKCYLPLILKVKDIGEAYEIQNSIIDQLREMGLFIISNNISEEFVTEGMLNQKLEIAKNKLKGAQIETLYIETRTIKKMTNEEGLNEGIKYYQRREKFSFSVRKVRSDAQYLLPEFNVLIEKDNTIE